MRLPRTAVAVDHFHLISLANQAITETRQNLSQQVKGRRGRAVDKAWAHRMLLLRAGDTLSCRAALRLEEVFAFDDPTGTLQAVWKVKEQLRALLRTGSLEDAATAKEVLEELVNAEEPGIPHRKLVRAHDKSALSNCGLVVEAAPEEFGLKSAGLAAVESTSRHPHGGPRHPSALSVTRLSGAAGRTGYFCGFALLEPCNPLCWSGWS